MGVLELSNLDPRLLRLTYASRAADWVTRDDLRSIAQIAQKRNKERHVTGLLLFVEGDFLQVLEGPPSAVEEIYETIEADPRNKWVTRLAAERVLRRAFEDWSMGCFEVGLEALSGEDSFFVLNAAAPHVRPRFSGDFSVFLDQFYARNRARGRIDDFATV